MHHPTRIRGTFVAVAGAALFVSALDVSATALQDRDIARAVRAILDAGVEIPAQRLDVSTVNGIVSLTGSAPSLLAKERAVEIAQSVKGVRAVVDRITVRSLPRPDEELAEDIRRALIVDPATEGYEVRIAVRDGAVTLTGTVQSWVERQLAADVAKGVRGVRRVDNRVFVQYRGDRTDEELEAEIRGRMRADAWLIGADLDVEVTDGHVGLSGTAPSVTAKSRATLDAWVPGVRSVDNAAIEVSWEARERRKHLSDTLKTDDEIRSAVVQALLYDPRVQAFEPRVDVRGGVVTLWGTVGSLKAKRAAEEDASNTAGVAAVVNRLAVRPAGRVDDETVARNVHSALVWDPFVDRFDLSVRVEGGVALLLGTVDSLAEKQRAEEVASRVNGVVDVRNRITVAPSADLDAERDREIQEAVERQLFWSPFVDADEVRVSVRNGTVSLRGVVDSQLEKRLAGENAIEGGARMVLNHLAVQGGAVRNAGREVAP